MTEATIKTIQLLVFDPEEDKEEGTPSVRMGVRPDGEDRDALQWLTAHSKVEGWQLAIGCNPFEAVKNGDGFSLIGKRVMIETESKPNYQKIVKVEAIVEEATPEPTADETDFSDLAMETEPKKLEVKKDGIPF